MLSYGSLLSKYVDLSQMWLSLFLSLLLLLLVRRGNYMQLGGNQLQCMLQDHFGHIFFESFIKHCVLIHKKWTLKCEWPFCFNVASKLPCVTWAFMFFMGFSAYYSMNITYECGNWLMVLLGVRILTDEFFSVLQTDIFLRACSTLMLFIQS